jgi:hypothetical protein
VSVQFLSKSHCRRRAWVLLQDYIATLEGVAGNYETDKATSARDAVTATLTLLITLKKPRHLYAPLIEAVNLIEKATGLKAVTKELAGKIFQSIAVTLQLDCKVKEKDALKNVVGNNPDAAKKLKNFRNNMLGKDSPKGAKDLYFKTLNSHFKKLPAPDAAKKALRICKDWEGKKS